MNCDVKKIDTAEFLDDIPICLILPVEIIEMIFYYLSFDDIKNASTVCKQWFEASNCPEIVSRCKLRIFTNTNDQREYKRTYKNLIINFRSGPDIFPTNLFLNFSKTVTEITLCWFDRTEEFLLQLIDQFPNLTSLILMYYDTSKTLEFNNILIKIIDKLKTFKMDLNFSITTDVFDKISDKIPTIENLSLNIINISICDYFLLYNLLRILSGKLKCLTIASTNLSYFLPDILQLKSLSLQFSSIQPQNVMFFKNLTLKLIELEIEGVIDTLDLTDICFNLPTLKRLIINSSGIFENGLIEINRLKNLEILHLSKFITENGIINGIALNKNENMKEISLKGSFSDDSLIAIAEKFPNLQSIYTDSSEYFSGKCLFPIFKHLTKLRNLCLIANKKDLYGYVPPEYVVPSLNINNYYAISRLKRLRQLRLIGFSGFFGVALEDISELKELELLSLEDYGNVTENGINMLAENCSRLKNVTIDEKESRKIIDDNMMYILGTKLKSLEFISINSNKNISPECLENIMKINKRLTMLRRFK